MSTNPGMVESLANYYADKKEDYYENSRPEMLACVPTSAKKILDVGCGRGAFGRTLKARSACEVWGVEPDSSSIPQASATLEKTIHGCFGPEMDLPTKYFDAVIFNDVLEHILDPHAALSYARSLLTDDGVIVASIPNIGHFPIVWKLVMRGEWDYKERGILDKTHVRFFTRKSIIKMFESVDFTVRSIAGINPYAAMEQEDYRIWKYYRWTRLVGIQSVQDMRYLQFAIVAEKKTRNTGPR